MTQTLSSNYNNVIMMVVGVFKIRVNLGGRKEGGEEDACYLLMLTSTWSSLRHAQAC